MNRRYEIVRIENGWKMTLFEDGEEVGGGKGQEDDYDALLQAAEDFCGVCYGITYNVKP